ncbi:type III-A CRISPR-associated RAMP protein Csm3 [Marinitoga sp. 38H-ov]|uniref:type III-A CRISPR-associated RAMP protein Csm3 n=1 Tax=Marinitoga sp. 38H-ov TaxID=1755814 RepID=UPI0013E9A6A9|nr:type III-A CRISPR-associated RAMP protein Csm3 [Marinitoga sp. 38H-ov]KAF2955971.1 type III-A CRISPR-associated RAMP protein Csm3 [Marinitoga sp. 38H-ov]
MTGKIIEKIIIKGEIELKSGLHIGGADFGISIGGIDSPVIRNPLTNEPYIPGSSLKGKMRSLLEKVLDVNFVTFGNCRNAVKRHECNDENCKVCRLFGSSKDNISIPSKIIVRDAHLTKESKELLEKLDTDLPYTEWKTENSLDRITAAATPRQIERVPAGTKFEFEIVYNVEDINHKKEDLENIFKLLELVEEDYLGKGGSRGNGKVKFVIDKIIKKDREYFLNGNKSKEIEYKESPKEVLNKLQEILE